VTHALIVDDDVDSVATLQELIASEKFTVSVAHTLRDARRHIALQQPDVVLLDLQLPDGNGMELFQDPQLVANSEVVLITGHASLDTSIQALRMGAADYLVKPINIRQLQGGALARDEAGGVAGRGGGSDGQPRAQRPLRPAVGAHRADAAHLQQISRVAGTSVSVFINGESGTGKELVAQTVHDLSRRRKKPFLAVNCGAISPNLIESEIFGHEKGAFTGADKQHEGFFERASGGTLFLDELTEMPMELQVKLLRVLETGRFMRVGSTTTLDADVRVIAASNRPLLQAVQAGKLREDLLYRLNVFPIEMPPLRDRLDDVPLLADHFLRQIAAKEGKNKRFTAKALAQLQTYHWPGNVRELRNAVQRAYVMAAGEVVDEQWLPKGEGAEPQSTAASSAASTTIAAPAAPAAPAASGTGYAAHGTAGAPPASESSGPSVTMRWAVRWPRSRRPSSSRRCSTTSITRSRRRPCSASA